MALAAMDILAIEKLLNRRGKLAESAIGTLAAALDGLQPAGSYATLVAGYVPTSQLGSGTPGAGKYVDGASGVWTGLPAAAPHGILSATHNDTTAAPVQVGDLMTGQAGPVWARLAIGTPTFVLRVPVGPNPVPTWAGLVESDVANLTTDLAGKAAASHTHVESDVTNLTADLAAKAIGKQAEIDFGATPVADATFTVTDASVSATSKLVAQVAWEAPTGKDVDEIEMDDLQIRCKPASGSFDMFIHAADGSYLADKFKIYYIIG